MDNNLSYFFNEHIQFDDLHNCSDDQIIPWDVYCEIQKESAELDRQREEDFENEYLRTILF